MDQAAGVGRQEQELTFVVRLAFITAAALAGAAVDVYAGDQGDPNANCDGGTYQMVDCLAAQTAQWDKKMTAAYRAQMKELIEAGTARAIARRAAAVDQVPRCQLLYYRLGEGSLAIVDGASCFLRMTKERALELEGPGDRN